MRFVFNERKAAQAAAQLLLAHEGHSMDLYNLIKLLYVADRRALIATGYTITGDKMVSMERGPVLSLVYDAIKGKPRPKPHAWADYVRRQGDNTLVLRTDAPENDELSPYVLKLLAKVHADFGNHTFGDLKEMTHEFPEWHNPEQSSSPIAPEEILHVAGKSAADVERLSAAADAHWKMAEALNRFHR